MHEKVQLERLLEGLRGHDWLRVMGISGITETEKKLYEPKRDHLIREVKILLEKFRLWKEEEKRRKVEKEEEDDEDLPMRTETVVKPAKSAISVALKDVNISREGKVIVGGKEESGRTAAELEEGTCPVSLCFRRWCRERWRGRVRWQ